MSLTTNMSEKPSFIFEEESQSDKLARKSKESPFFPIGIAGLIAALGYGVYKFKRRGEMSPSVFLMQLRVGAQGMVVGALTVGLAYTMIRNMLKEGSEKDKE